MLTALKGSAILYNHAVLDSRRPLLIVLQPSPRSRCKTFDLHDPSPTQTIVGALLLCSDSVDSTGALWTQRRVIFVKRKIGYLPYANDPHGAFAPIVHAAAAAKVRAKEFGFAGVQSILARPFPKPKRGFSFGGQVN